MAENRGYPVNLGVVMPYETDRWPFTKAKHFKKITGKRAVRLIVIHTMEAPEGHQTAENVARYFAAGTAVASAHVCIDNDSIVQCVFDNDVAYAAPGANHDGIQIELAGYARQGVKEWMDDYSILMLTRAADVVAQYCLKFSIPPTHLSNADLAAGKKGIIGHNQATAVYKKSTHTDPGSSFPWLFFMEAVKLFRVVRSK